MTGTLDARPRGRGVPAGHRRRRDHNRRRWCERLPARLRDARPVAGGRSAVARVRSPTRPRYAFRGLHVDLARQWFEPDGRRAADRCRRLAQAVAPPPAPDRRRGMADPGGSVSGAGCGRRRARTRSAVAADARRRAAVPPARAYTADEIAGWVARADALGIVLVPEVDLPAHVHAALTALPAPARSGRRVERASACSTSPTTCWCPGTPRRCRSSSRVVDAVAELFPSSPYDPHRGRRGAARRVERFADRRRVHA